jgi:hypothetical protein
MVLSAIEIDSHIDQQGVGIDVAAADADRAAPRWPIHQRAAATPADHAAPPVQPGATSTGIVAALLLLAFHAVVVNAPAGSEWRATGSAAATRILGGEWWRVVTALTCTPIGRA